RVAAIIAAIDAIQRAGHERLRIGRCHRQSAHRLPVHVGKNLPGLAAIMAAEYITSLLVLNAPCGNVNSLGVLRIESNVVENIIIATSQVRKARPALAVIIRDEEGPSAVSQEDLVRI